MRRVKLGVVVGDLNAGDHQVVLLVRCVGPQNQPVDCVVLPLRPAEVPTQLRLVCVCQHFCLNLTDRLQYIEHVMVKMKKKPLGLLINKRSIIDRQGQVVLASMNGTMLLLWFVFFGGGTDSIIPWCVSIASITHPTLSSDDR